LDSFIAELLKSDSSAAHVVLNIHSLGGSAENIIPVFGRSRVKQTTKMLDTKQEFQSLTGSYWQSK
jgi:predicted esterase